jgi:TetR/AcrR family acrAB operon transcriptional repressor
MVRKTKQAALETRDSILDAAERVFHAKGVSRATLSDIAAEAGVTRGAIYWHFSNKAEVFDAMMRRAVEPLEAMDSGDYAGEERPLETLRVRLAAALGRIQTDPAYLRVFTIAWHKSEYVDEMVPIVDQCLEAGNRHRGRVEQAMVAARARGELPDTVDPRHAALGLIALIDGLIADWCLQPRLFSNRVTMAAVDAYLSGLRSAPAPS